MPIPKPRKGETQKAFISRCMGSSGMNNEFPDQKQRAAVCHTSWRQAKGNEDDMKANEFKCNKCGWTLTASKSIGGIPINKCMSCEGGTLMPVTTGSMKHNEKDKPTTNQLRHLMSALIRRDTLDGEEYLVIPTVLICEGVHNNALYPAEELAKYPDAWNGRPVCIVPETGHPEDEEGRAITANSPDLKEKVTVGQLFNTEWMSPKLHSEAWVSIKKLMEVEGGADVLKMLEEDKNVEVSTGLFTDDIDEEGDWNGEKYDAIAVNHRPDHLVLLPFSKGACSWNDGAGMPRINKEEDKTSVKELKDKAAELGLAVLELSHDDIRTSLIRLLREGIGESNSVWVREVFDNEVVFEKEVDGVLKLLKQSYSVNAKEEVSLEGDPVEVVVKTEFVPVTTNASPKSNKGGTGMDREARIKALAEKVTDLSEEDRKLLLNIKDDQQFERTCKAMEAGVEDPKKNAEEEAAAKKKEEEAAAAKAAEEAKTNKAKEKDEDKPKTLEETLAEMPPEMAAMTRRAVARENAYKDQLVTELKANERCGFTEEQLRAKDVDELETLADMADVEVDYSGIASGDLSVNEGDDEVPEPPDLIKSLQEKEAARKTA